MSNSLEAAMKKTATNDPLHTTQVKHRSTLIGGRFDSMVSRELGILAAEEETTKQKLLEEAVDLLLAKRNRPSIAELESG